MTMNHYETLQISPGATRNEIRDAYLRLAMVHHPDMNGGHDPDGRFLDISNAYQALRRAAAPETETAIPLEIPLPTIFAGGRHVCAMQLRERCPVCCGSGEIKKRICPACDGRGHHPLQGDVRVDIPRYCPEGEILDAAFTCPQRPEAAIRVSVMDAAHPAFRRVGLDIRARLVVPRGAAKQGGMFVIESPVGDSLAFQLPERSVTGHQITVAGAGSPHREGQTRGNLIIDLVVEPRRSPGRLLLSSAGAVLAGILPLAKQATAWKRVAEKSNGAARLRQPRHL